MKNLQIVKFENKLLNINNTELMNEENVKIFVRYLHKLYVLQKMKNFKDGKLPIQWLQSFFNSKHKFESTVLWNTTLNKIFKIALQILLLDHEIKFSLQFLSTLVDSHEIANIVNFDDNLNKIGIIFTNLYEQIFFTCIFHEQRLFFKIVYEVVQQLEQKYQEEFVRKIFNVKLSAKILQMKSSNFEFSARSIINRLNEKSDVFKTFAIVAKSIQIGNVSVECKLFDNLWIDFNIIVMEVSFYLDYNNDTDIINIPINCISDITTVNNDETKINIELNSNKLFLENGGCYNITGLNCITITLLTDNDKDTLTNYIIPAYIKWINDHQSGYIESRDSIQTVFNNENCSNAIETQSNLSVVVIDDTQKSNLITNGVYESFKKTESESQMKNIIVQRVDPLPKSDVIGNEIKRNKINTLSATVIPESQAILIRRLHYRVYSEETQEIPIQNAPQHVQNMSLYVPHRSQLIDGSMVVIQFDARMQDNQERMKVERINNWLNKTAQITNGSCETYSHNFVNENIIDQIEHTTKFGTTEYETDKLFSSPPKKVKNNYFLRSRTTGPKKVKNNYFLRSRTTKPNMFTEKVVETLNGKFGRELYNLLEETAQKFDIPQKDSINDKKKLLKRKQRKILTKSFDEISESIKSIQRATENIQKLKHKVINKLNHQTRRIRRYKTTVAAHKVEMSELDVKANSIIDQFKTNLIKIAEPAEKQIWNNYVLNLSHHVQNHLLKNLFES